MNSATANASIAETIAALTTSAGNCAILDLLSASSAQTIPVPTNFTSRATTAGANGSIRMADAALLAAGTSLAQSVAITSADWSSFGIAILGSGSGVAAAHSSQVPEQVLYNYSDPTILHVSQVVIQVLRTVTTQTGHVRFNMPMMGR
jgi:hypothetical protein